MAGEKTRFIENLNTANVHGELEEVHDTLFRFYETLVSDHRDDSICAGYADYMAETPQAFLNRAGTRLKKKGFKVGFAGGFSGGKSTLINAVLAEPGLLPAEAGECTMSITLMQAPPKGGDEHIEIKYYTREEALRNIFENNRYAMLLADMKAQVFDDYSDDRAIAAIKDTIARLATDSDRDNQKKRGELEEFLHYLDKYNDRLGILYLDSIANGHKYLTTDSDGKGLGHLLLIEQVFIYKRNPLFSEKSVQIIDLPGTDSVNVRQREITHTYMSEADAVVLVLEPKGFKMADVDIKNELGKHNNEVRSKMFFVMNKFDTLSHDDIDKKSIEKLYRAQVVDTVVRLGLDPDRIFLTSAKMVELQAKKDKGAIGTNEEKDLQGMKESAKGKLDALDETISPDLLNMMKVTYKDGGVTLFRNKLLKYLERDIRVDRFREIFTDLRRVYDSTRGLLEPERSRVKDLLENLKNKRVMVNEFIEKTQNVFYDEVSFINDRVEGAAEGGIAKAKEKLEAGITMWCDKYNFNRLRTKLAIPTPLNIKMETITQAKNEFAQKFATLIEESIVRLIGDKLKSQLADSKLPEILKYFSKALEEDYQGRFEAMLEGFARKMKEFTIMRATEETWDILYSEVKPTAHETEWSEDIEKHFREDLKETFKERFISYANKLAGVLGRYYKMLIKGLIEEFEKFAQDLADKVKADPDRVSLPMNLITDEEEGREREYKLATYFQLFDGLKKHYETVESLLGSTEE
jgi:GTPase SAR1 family protein